MLSKARLKNLSPWNTFEYSMKNIQNTSHMQKNKALLAEEKQKKTTFKEKTMKAKNAFQWDAYQPL